TRGDAPGTERRSALRRQHPHTAGHPPERDADGRGAPPGGRGDGEARARSLARTVSATPPAAPRPSRGRGSIPRMNTRRARVLHLVAEAHIDTPHPAPSGHSAAPPDVP